MIEIVGEALIDAHVHHDLIRPHPGGGAAFACGPTFDDVTRVLEDAASELSNE
jgi:hypothetical protein